MNKITKTSTKEEIMKALEEAEKEVGILNTEIVTLNGNIEHFEILVKEEDVKKKGLVEQLASQSANIELARKKTEKYAEIKTMLKSTREELEAVKAKLFNANKKIELLQLEITKLEEELTRPKKAVPLPRKQKEIFKLFPKAAAACIIVVATIVAMIYLHVDEDHYPMYFAKYDNGVIGVSHDANILTLKAKDGGDLEIGGVDVAVSKWAMDAGYDGVLYGKIIRADDGRIVLHGNGDYDYTTVDMVKLGKEFEKRDCYNVLALVDNPENIILPGPFKTTSQGELKFYEGRRKLAGFVPVLWGKDRRILYVVSDNINGFISSDAIFMNDGTIKASVSLITKEELPMEKKEN